MTEALVKVKIIWDDRNIDLSSKIRLYSCQTCTLTARIKRASDVSTASHTKIMSLTKECDAGFRKPSELKKTHITRSQDLQDLQRQSSRAPYGEGGGETDRENNGKETSGCG